METSTDSEKNLNEIERQLHEQYAENNHSYMGHIITLIVGLFGVIGFYGYVFVNSSHFFEKVNDYDYTLGDLCFVAICAYVVLGIIAYICIYQGMHQRHEQFIVWAIRQNFYGENYNIPKIFSDDYIPFKEGGLAIIQGLYGEFVKVISLVAFCVTISLIAKVGYNIYALNNYGEVSYCGVAICLITFIAHVTVYFFCVKRFKRGEEKYRKLINEYKHLYTSEPKPVVIKPVTPKPFKKVPNKKFFLNFFILTSLLE